jgi:hypothetical protein
MLRLRADVSARARVALSRSSVSTIVTTRSPACRRLRQVDHRRGDPLRTLTLGRSYPLPRRRPHRDRLQCSRALDPSDRARAQIISSPAPTVAASIGRSSPRSSKPAR